MSEAITIKEETGLSAYDAELAAIAGATAAQEKVVGEFFSIKAGQLSFGGSPIPGNQMTVVILDGIHENIYYEGTYSDTARSGPLCFALGRSEEGMKPDAKVVAAGTAQHETCEGCQWNEWGSADVGKGKACKNIRRLSILTASKIERDGTVTLIEDPEHFKAVSAGYLRVPVTSVKNYSSMVNTLNSSMRLPTFAVYTRVSVAPDPKTQVRIDFTPVKPVPAELLPVLLERFKMDKDAIMFTGSVMSKAEREAAAAAAEEEEKKRGLKKRKFQK